jgi:hypothetical protein
MPFENKNAEVFTFGSRAICWRADPGLCAPTSRWVCLFGSLKSMNFVSRNPPQPGITKSDYLDLWFMGSVGKMR